MWSQSYAGNSYYLATADNGMGLHQIFAWANGRNNTHGVNGGGSNNADPLYCDSHLTSYPCDEADDENWSHTVLTQQEGDVIQAASNGNATVSSISQYAYKLTWPLPAQECSDCVAGMYWGNQNDGDYLDYYNAKFMGFAEADVANPDGSIDKHYYDATEGYGVYDATVPCLAYVKPCRVAPWWDLTNVAHGHETEADYYDTDGATLLKQVKNQYQSVCPPSGISGTPSWSTTVNGSPYTYTWDSKLVAELDHGNPVAVCDVQTARVDAYTWDGAGSGTAVPQSTTTYSYDSYGRVTAATTSSNDGGATGSPTTIVQKTNYIWNDAVSATMTSATGTYLIDIPALIRTEDSGGTTRASCVYTSYDGAAYALGQQSTLTKGLVTTSDTFTSCGTSPSFTPSGKLEVTATYDAWGNQVTTNDPDANAGVSSHKGCTVGSATYTACLAYETTFDVLPISSANALTQHATIGYSVTTDATGGFGLWPTAATDANGQTATTAYDALGRTLSATLPGETSGLTTTATSYTVWCSATGAQTPCVEVDSTQRLDSGNTVTARNFYDGYGRLIETRSAAPGGQDVVTYAQYDTSGRQTLTSMPYFVAAYSGAPGAAAFATPDTTQAHSYLTYTSLLAMTTTDPLGNSSTASASVICAPSGTGGDSACYAQTTSVDANGHKSASLTRCPGPRDLYPKLHREQPRHLRRLRHDPERL